jgi:hypothetical protein
MNFENTMTETDLDPAAREFARSLREQGVQQEPDWTVDGFDESLGRRLLKMLRIVKG